MSITQLVSMIPDWLAVTAGREVSAGLCREDALRRASVLRGLLRDGKLDPAQVVLDEDLKAVFHALVALVTEIEPRGGEPSAEETNGAYQFLAGVEWPEDDFEEKRGLLRWLAEAGWQAMGISFAEVERRRLAGASLQTIHDFSVDPNSFLGSVAPMPDSAKVIQFPRRATRQCLSPEGARAAAAEYLATPVVDRTDEYVREHLQDADVLLALCSTLKEKREVLPAVAALEAENAYYWLRDSSRNVGVFDELDYFLGEMALIAGGANRLLGKRDEAELWFDRSESAFRLTINSAPQLANVAYSRLTVHYDRRTYARVLEPLPSLTLSFDRLGMKAESLKCRFLEAMVLKETSRASESRDRLARLREDEGLRAVPLIHGFVLANLGELLAAEGREAEALDAFNEALPVVESSGQPLPAVHLKTTIAEGLRRNGRVAESLETFRSAARDYAALGMQAPVVYCRIVMAEMLVGLARPREAEWEILQALPTIEEQKMVPEGFAAVALLRESVKRRKADPNALRELREHLQKQN